MRHSKFAWERALRFLSHPEALLTEAQIVLTEAQIALPFSRANCVREFHVFNVILFRTREAFWRNA